MTTATIGEMVLICLVVVIVIGVVFDTTIMYGASVTIGGDTIMGAAALGITGLMFTFLLKLNRELSETRERIAKLEAAKTIVAALALCGLTFSSWGISSGLAATDFAHPEMKKLRKAFAEARIPTKACFPLEAMLPCSEHFEAVIDQELEFITFEIDLKVISLEDGSIKTPYYIYRDELLEGKEGEPAVYYYTFSPQGVAGIRKAKPWVDWGDSSIVFHMTTWRIQGNSFILESAIDTSKLPMSHVAKIANADHPPAEIDPSFRANGYYVCEIPLGISAYECSQDKP